ncbi:Duplicated ATPase component CbrU of energizing module of predicted cobalamin ECF transporter [Lachnospiraceae bacterium TWA4]|nr:Duplicated ATPase component CbrU of energizing module of predicted cobalamin ECF transporter [Lachnospiraceae bacterium TWA4]
MNSIEVKNFSFSYPESKELALNNVNLTVEEGSFVVLCGKSGCGKSTLLRQLKTVLAPHGVKKGEIYYRGKNLDEVSHREQSEGIGYVLQNPDNQIVTDKVWHELAFGLESLGFDTETIRLRVAEMASYFGIQEWFLKNVSELSGGQKQLLNLASVMAMHPNLLILDEPTSQLDPIAASDFLETVRKINRDIGTTIIITEHRLEDVIPWADELFLMDNGKVLMHGKPEKLGLELKEKHPELFLMMPTPMQIYAGTSSQLDCPLTVSEGRSWMSKELNGKSIQPFESIKEESTTDIPMIRVKDLWFRYDKDLPDVVQGLSMDVKKGELFALVGGNGTGKSTTLSLLAKIRYPYRGKIYLEGKDINKYKDDELYHGLLGVMPQNPQSLFVKKTVRADLYEMIDGKKEKRVKAYTSDMKKAEAIAGIAALTKLEHLLDRHPYDLSGGEQQRLALAKILLLRPKILLMDEPTKGIDNMYKKELGEILRTLTKHGVTILMISHDVEFCAKYADRTGLFFQGSLVTCQDSRSFFAGNNFYTTAANRMARGYFSTGSYCRRCGGCNEGKWCRVKQEQMEAFLDAYWENSPLPETVDDDFWEESTETVNADLILTPIAKGKLSKRTIVSIFLILLAVPLTIWFGITYLNDRKYLVVSLVIAVYTLIPFFMVFEGRKPQARELLTISVLVAIAVAGRGAFFMIPSFKPVAAIVIIAGVSLGAETGFLVGAITMLTSNVLFGQGNWTPWQMLAMGVIGFIAGILFQKGWLKAKRISLCIYGFLATFLIYGGIMNPASLVMSSYAITKMNLIAIYMSGIPVDLVHASSTVIFLWLISQPMLEKLERIKVKYGLLEM